MLGIRNLQEKLEKNLDLFSRAKKRDKSSREQKRAGKKNINVFSCVIYIEITKQA